MSKTKWYTKPIYAMVALALVLSLCVVAVPMAGTVEASCPLEVWVDDSWTSQTDVDLFDPSLTWGWDAVGTIGHGVGIVCPGGTVHVRPGKYGGGINVDTANVTIQSTDGPEVTIVDPAAPNGFVVTAEGVTIDGFKITGFPGVSSPSPEGAGDSLQGVSWHGCGIVLTGDSSADNCIIQNNIIENNSHGIWIETDNNQILLNDILNNILANVAAPCGIHLTCGASGNVIHCNNIEGNLPHGIYNGNTLENVNAINNWWGDASGPSHSPGTGDGVSQNVTYDPWLPTEFQYCEECGGAPPSPPGVPTMNHWGIVAMTTLFAGLLVWTVRRRRLAS
jgi:parallel beta-helix repeat protein